MTNQELMRELINFLNYHTKKYQEGTPEISDVEWDNKYNMLKKLEQQAGVAYPDSPTQQLYFETVDELRKYQHGQYPMLSLDKTQELDEFKQFIGTKEIVLSAKMDGLSCKLCYLDGVLISAGTRGNGAEGEDITHNARVIQNVPLQIPIDNLVIITGEVICDEKTFQQFAGDFKNPRNFAAGAIRLLNAQESASRHLSFYAWDLVNSGADSYAKRLEQTIELGFTPAPFKVINGKSDDIKQAIYQLREDCTTAGLPIDGVVARYNDIEYGNSLGETAHHPRHSFAFKFADEVVETTLEDIEYEPSRNGIMTPVAIFKPVELLGSTISKASLHNLDIMERILGTHPWEGQQIQVVKSNMIIPQIISAEPETEDNINDHAECYITIPSTCPWCGSSLTVLTSDSGTRTLSCENVSCNIRFINKLDYFVGKSGFDIHGLSRNTLQKLIDWGWVEELEDIFILEDYKEDWIKKPGFGIKSVDNILNAIENSKKIDLAHFIAAFGLPGIGLNVAKEICKHIHSLDEFYKIMDGEIDCTEWNGFGRAKRNAIMSAKRSEIEQIAKYVEISEPVEENTPAVNGLSVVITGRLEYGSRSKFKDFLSSMGIKVTDTVSGKTNYLIANHPETSAKYKKAEELKIPIVSEAEFMEIIKK